MASPAAKKRRSSKGRRRSDAPRNYWTKPAGDYPVSQEDFRLMLNRRKRKLPSVELDPLVEHLDWQRRGALLVGEMNLRRPTPHKFPVESLIAKGDTVVVSARRSWRRGRFRQVFQMVVSKAPTYQVEDGSISVPLRSQTGPLVRSRVNWKFRKDKRHPAGWLCHEIAFRAATRFGLVIGRLAQGEHRITKLEDKRASVLDIVIRAYREERKASGNRFVIDLSKGRLDILPLRHPRFMHVLGPAIMSAMTKHSLEGFATTLIVVGSVKGKKGRRKKVRVTVVDRTRRRLYGEIVKTVKKNGLGSRTAMRRWGKRELARIHRPRSAITFTHPGIPWLDRGDAVRLSLPESGLLVTCYVRSVRHTLSAGSYEMEVTVGFTDPWLDEKQKRVEKKKAAAKRRRNKRTRGDTHPPTPKRNRRRAHA